MFFKVAIGIGPAELIQRRDVFFVKSEIKHMDKRLGIGTLALTGFLLSGAVNAATIIGRGSTDAQVDFVDFYNSSGGQVKMACKTLAHLA